MLLIMNADGTYTMTTMLGKEIGYVEKGRGSAKRNEWRAAIFDKPIWSVAKTAQAAADAAYHELKWYGVGRD
jgi:hypothetical protein